MDQVRNFTQSNRSVIVNIIYIVAAIVLVYYLVNWYFSDDEKDITVLRNKLEANTASASGGAKQKTITVVKARDSVGRATNEYTISMWMYINSYASGSQQGVLAFFDDAASNANISSNLYIGLHPDMPKLIVRAGNIKNATSNDPYTTYNYSGGTSASYSYGGDNVVSSGDTNEGCDVIDIDIQRWICVCVTVNGRILDVYLDGKLARSCIMPNVQNLSANGEQVIMLCPTSVTYNGHISGVVYSNYSVTPDVIYARYQAGPYFSSSFLDYLVDKLGVRISYTDAAGETTPWTPLKAFGLE
jgi:hypothetical protein